MSGAVGYLGAQRQADSMEAQAEAAENMARYNAQVQRNNAVAQAGDESFQASVAKYNAADSAQKRARALRDHRTQTAQKLARAEARGARTGTFDYSFDDVLRSDALLLEREEVDILSSGAEQRYQFATEAELADMRGSRALEVGQTQSNLTLAAGRNQSAAYRGQADSARIGGYSSFISGASQGAATASGIKF